VKSNCFSKQEHENEEAVSLEMEPMYKLGIRVEQSPCQRDSLLGVKVTSLELRYQAQKLEMETKYKFGNRDEMVSLTMK
jgi:hypothetical protein